MSITRREFISALGAFVGVVVAPFGWLPAIKVPEPQETPVTLANRSMLAFEPWGISGADVCKAMQAQRDQPQRWERHCPARCVILELQGRQNEPPVIYEVCQ